MSDGAWRYALASVAGTSHERHSVVCQDAAECLVVERTGREPVLLAVASDGAGSAVRADVGARVACRIFTEEAGRLCAGEPSLPGSLDDLAGRWVGRFQDEVGREAEAEGLRARDFACTVLAAVVGRDWSAFLQVGDGAIVVSRHEEPDEYAWVFWPQRGEYANETAFLTDCSAAGRLQTVMVQGAIDEVALFTDGMQALALHYETRTAFAPFFRPIFAALRADASGQPAALSGDLGRFLASAPVNRRTDDDKTLIVATRRLPALTPVLACAGSADDDHAA